jgi:Na+/H+-dicarboxylate symporter
MIFFSVISGISSMSYSTNLGRIGWRVVIWSLIKLGFFVAAGMLAGYLLGGMPELLSTLTIDEGASHVAGLTIHSLITGIVPGNVISPFANNNIMQTLFLACFCGVVLNRMGEQLDWAREGVNFMSSFTMNVVQTVSCLLPFLVGISTVKMVMQMGPVGLLTYGWLILVIALGLPLSFIVSALLVCLVSHWQPLAFLQKTVRFSALPFSSSNSSACLPATLKFCTEKLGMNERIVKFTVPVGMQFNMDGTAYYVSVISMVLACTFSVTIDAGFLFSLFCVEFLMAMTGVGLLVMPPVLESMGIPGTAVMHFIGIEPIIDMPGTAQNVVGDITSAFLVAQQEGQVDEAVYHS